MCVCVCVCGAGQCVRVRLQEMKGWIEYADGVEVVRDEEVEEAQVGPARPQSVHHLVPRLKSEPSNHHHQWYNRVLSHHQCHHQLPSIFIFIFFIYIHLSSLLRQCRWYPGCSKAKMG